MNVHLLKTDPVYFQAVVDGRKGFEVRNNDRKFEEGDVLILAEFRQKDEYVKTGWNEGYINPAGFTGRTLRRTVGLIVSDPSLMRDNYVAFQLEE